MTRWFRCSLASPALLTASAFRPAWVSTPFGQVAVDTFYFSALAPVRPTTSPPRTPRCPQTFGHLRRLLRHWLCGIRKQIPERLVGTPCRTAHRSENWAIPSRRATPSATSEHLVELLDSSSIFLSFVASCVSFQLRLLPSTGITRLHQYYEPLRHPSRPGLSLASCQLITAITAGTSRVMYGPLCLHAVANTSAGLIETCSLVRFHQLRPSPKSGRVGSCISRFGACSAFTHVTVCIARRVANATLCTRGSSSFVASTAALIATGWSEPVPGRLLRCGPSPFFTAHPVS